MFVFKIFVIVLMSTWDHCSPNRVKRVINGWRIVGREGPYDVIKYAVGIGSLHKKPWFTLGIYFSSLADDGVYGRIGCGGVVLSPYAIQTACHCLATMQWNPDRRKQAPFVNSNWENGHVIYIGLNDQWGDDSMMTTPPVVSQQFIPHQRCERIVPEAAANDDDDDDDDESVRTVFTYDFGLIKIKPDWTFGWLGVPTTNVAFAPLYTREELERMYHDLPYIKPVCLVVGYGDTDHVGTDSAFLRGGWTRLMDIEECVEYTATDKHGHTNMNEREISQYMSWICSESFALFSQPAGSGDSGGPLSCNNAFFGLVQGISEIRRLQGTKKKYYVTQKVITHHSAIYFTLFENTSTYRREFDRALRDVSGITYHDIIKRLARKWGDDFVEHVAEEALEEAVESIIEEAISAARTANQSRKNYNARSRSLKKPTSISRLVSQERAVLSVSHTMYASPVLLVFIPITHQPFF